MADRTDGLLDFRASLARMRKSLDQKIESRFKKASRSSGRFLLYDRNIPSFDAQLFTQLAPCHPRLPTQLRDCFPQVQKLTRNRIVRIACHVPEMKFFEIVAHK